MTRRRVAIITGTRAEYGLLRSTLQAVAAHERLTLQVVVTGMHLMRSFGYTVDEIRADGWRIAAEVPMAAGRARPTAVARGLSRGIDGLSQALQRLRSELVVVTGDRVEAFAGAVAAATMNRTVVHVHGGDVAPGHLDDSLRHAITKLAHVHCAASRDAAQRIARLGEQPRHIHVVGAPGLDDFRTLARPSAGWLAAHCGFRRDDEVAVVLYHPIGRADALEQRAMQRILTATERAGYARLVIYPNSDPGCRGVISAITAAGRQADPTRWRVVRSLPRGEFLGALRQAAVLVGNSSCGVIEAHTAGVLAVNVGPRQSGRHRNRGSVIDCGESIAAIVAALHRARRRRPPRRPFLGVYGAGRAGQAIARVLAACPTSDKLQPKRIAY